MGRQQWGSTNLGIKSSLYHTCFRARNGASCNFSMSNYIRKTITPYLYNGNSGSTNSTFSGYVCNKGYVYGIALKNSNPSRGTGRIKLAGTSTIVYLGSSSTNNATYGTQYNVISNSYSYINISFSATSGNTFNGWYTSPSGGTRITSSTSYNAYYTNSYISGRTIWYSQTAAAPSRYTTFYPYGPGAFTACNSGNGQTFFVSTAYSALTAPKIYANSVGNTGAPAGFYSNGFQYRRFNGSSWLSSPGSCLF